MKVCKFCGTKSPDSATVCSSCGANEFSYRCGNCGTEFDEGNFCPKCGVKVGAKAKKCPRCGAEYYSAACPDCGYIKNNADNSDNADRPTVIYADTVTQPVDQPVKKRRTWLWVLGWIFIFPLPITVLVARSQKLGKWEKVGIIALVWLIFLIIGYARG